MPLDYCPRSLRHCWWRLPLASPFSGSALRIFSPAFRGDSVVALTSSGSGFGPAFVVIWLRLVTLGVVTFVFGDALWLAPGKAQGWSFYLTTSEVLFEVAVRFIAAGLFGLVVGTICAAVLAPFLWYLRGSRSFIVDSATKVAVVLVVVLASRYALEVLIKWSYGISTHRAIYDKLLLDGQFAVFAVALCIPRARRAVVSSLDGFLTPKMTRRTALATVGGAAALVVTEFALGRSLLAVRAALPTQRPESNFLLVTFDALCAEDMSLYGCKLPTTPNIDRFASGGTIFTNFYSASTFTTPSVATMLTGMYPSESHVCQLQGRLHPSDADRSLPGLMHASGYATAAFLSNPFAYYLAKSLRNGISLLPEPVFQQGGLQSLWNATRPLHQDSGFGSRMDEYVDLEHIWNTLTGSPGNLSMRFRAVKSIEQAERQLAQLPDGHFLWLHVITPHSPYLPDRADRGRFLPDTDLRTYEEESGDRWKPRYPSEAQDQVNQRRLRYDEFIATADRAFGAFMNDLEEGGRLTNTTVIVSADHGESFEGGVYQHSSPYLTRPVIHVPLIIRTPGQKDGRTVSVTADQTSLAPTILDLAGIARPESMRGPSLKKWLTDDAQPESHGLAFCQYFERNSVYKPLRHGTVGVIDGEFQYVVYVDTQKGELRPLAEAQIWNLDRSSEHPERATALRNALSNRFPDLVGQTT
jgi:arylsulfatase A-like enzyme